jgi:hypothetical protein
VKYRVLFPCGDGICHEDFETRELADTRAMLRQQQLQEDAKRGLVKADAWMNVHIRELTAKEKAQYL